MKQAVAMLFEVMGFTGPKKEEKKGPLTARDMPHYKVIMMGRKFRRK